MQRLHVMGTMAMFALCACSSGSGSNPVPQPDTGGTQQVFDAGFVDAALPVLDGAMGEDDASLPAPKTIAAKSLSVGRTYACAVRVDGEVDCSGDPAPAPAPVGVEFTRVHVSGGFVCGETTANTVQCWGSDRFGQLDAPDLPASHVSVGGSGGCLIAEDRSLSCWGTVARGVPQSIVELEKVFLARLGTQSACGVSTEGATVCWGVSQGYRI